MRYLYPCKPNLIAADSQFFNEIDKDKRWIAEVKKNGWRCLAEKGKLWTRYQTLIEEPLGELRKAIDSFIPEGTMLDGELLDHRGQGKRGRLYLFDIIWLKDELLIAKPLKERRKILEKVVKEIPGLVEIARQVQVGKKQLYEYVLKSGLPEDEGIVLKKVDSLYVVSNSSSPKNPFWLKIRKPKEK